MMTDTSNTLLKIAAVLWVVWGLVHLLAGVMVLSNDATGGLQAIGDAVAPETIVMDYPGIVDGVLNQHGWNLAWFGVLTVVGAVFIWRGARTWIWLTALIGGLADLGYFLFIDLAGFANFIPGTLMTLISASAIILSAIALRSLANENVTA